MAKSACHIWNSSLCLVMYYLHVIILAYFENWCWYIILWIHCVIFVVWSIWWDKWLKLVKLSMRRGGFHTAPVHAFKQSLCGYFVLMDKRSMTLDIPLPHEAALTSCSHVDNMCCFGFCLWNLPAKQDHEQRSSLSVLWPFIFLPLASLFRSFAENVVTLMKRKQKTGHYLKEHSVS